MPLPFVENIIADQGVDSVFAEDCRDLPPMVGGVVDDVEKYVADAVFKILSPGGICDDTVQV